MKAFEQNMIMWHSTLLYKVALTFNSVDETFKQSVHDHWNESYLAALPCGTVYQYAVKVF